ncbi:MAG: hypothetical protein ASARMPRED_004022 [Alectoria sarmentosa]|nr:MAG: hypothetical protein ASARMPRED_004022 [Alectoria sarmentosa]
MKPIGPRQQFSFESVLICVEDLQHLNTESAFDGLEEGEKRWQLKEFCTKLILAVKHPSEHLRQLDAHFSQLLPGALKQHPGLVSPDHITGSDSRTNKAKSLLARFPKVPQRLFTLPLNNSRLIAKRGTIWDGIKDGRWAKKYLVPEARSLFALAYQDDAESVMQLMTDMQNHAWDNLFVTSFIDTNNSVFLLKVAELGHRPDLDFARSFWRYVKTLGELVDEYDGLVDSAKFGLKEPFEDPAPSVQALKAALFPHEADDHEQSLSVLKAFLWSAWQRSITLYFHYVIGVQLWLGFSSTWSSLLAVRGVRRLIDLDAEDYRGDSTQYLCNWAFELLRTNRTSLALDFRHSACIPDDHQLRKEAIMTINSIFSDSKVTLISDKDLQSKSVSSRSMEDLETLLSILLVCDWGVRAWTMLEAIRANKSIHILCAGDQTIRLVDLLRTVHDEGAVDLAVLLGSAQHLLPSADSVSAKPIEEVGHLLSQRHASRNNDEITIWGLLSKLKAPKNVLQFWEASEQVNTAFLMSSAPRVKGIYGYGWAPLTPYIRPQRREVQLDESGLQVYSVRYPSYDGRGSFNARITPQGLWSLWLVHDLDQGTISELCDTCVEEMIPTQWTDRDIEEPLIDGDHETDSKIFERPDYAKACKTLKALSSTPDSKVRIIRPLSREGTDPYLGNVARGEDFIILVAICVSNNFKAPGHREFDEWQWKGVYEWIDDTHPDWAVNDMLIV